MEGPPKFNVARGIESPLSTISHFTSVNLTRGQIDV